MRQPHTEAPGDLQVQLVIAWWLTTVELACLLGRVPTLVLDSQVNHKKGFNIDFDTVKPLNSGHLQVLKNLSVIERCPLLGGNFTLTVIFGTEHFACYSRYICYWEVSRYFKVVSGKENLESRRYRKWGLPWNWQFWLAYYFWKCNLMFFWPLSTMKWINCFTSGVYLILTEVKHQFLLIFATSSLTSALTYLNF